MRLFSKLTVHMLCVRVRLRYDVDVVGRDSACSSTLNHMCEYAEGFFLVSRDHDIVASS